MIDQFIEDNKKIEEEILQEIEQEIEQENKEESKKSEQKVEIFKKKSIKNTNFYLYDLLESLNKNTCDTIIENMDDPRASILAAKCLALILGSHGWETKILPVKIGIYNHKWAQFLQETGHQPKDEKTARQWYGKGGCALGVGMPDDDFETDDQKFALRRSIDPRGYRDYVVTIIENTWLLDPMIGYNTKPEKDIFLGPVMAKIQNKSFLHGGFQLGEYQKNINDAKVLLHYQSIPSDHSYMKTQEWHSKQIRNLCEKIVQKVLE